jgi:antitoxin (DNA-binding transcriptional repressor) of toxin-antitoxin stability system
MKFMSVREFRVNTGTMRRDVDRDEEVVLTANGQPFAIVSAVNPESFDKELRAIRGARAKVALERVRESAARSGAAAMPMARLDTIVRDIRRAKRTA